MSEVTSGPSLVNDAGYGGPLLDFEYKPVFEPFVELARTMPDRPAIVQGDRRLSYAQLADEARALASFLRAKGARGPERIGVCVERSIEATVAMLGVLAAGLVYVPIDTRNPRDRVEHMLATSNIHTVLISAGSTVLDRSPGLELIPVADAISSGTVTSDLPEVAGGDEAYVIYTSGTTGAPKGVVGRHLEFAKQIHGWMQIGYRLQGVRSALIASYGFDSSFLEHFLALNGGGCLYAFEHDDICDTRTLASMIERHRIEFAILSPALLGGVASYFEETSRTLPLEYLVSGGEPVPNEALKRFHALKPDLDLRVGYGTTEATVAIATHRFDPDRAEARYSPVGVPMPGYYVFLLDDQGALVPHGEIGEVHVSGEVLTQGYDSNQEETKRRFIGNPFFDEMKRDDKHTLMYKTGDLAAFDSGGALTFKGRVDNQVQIRGLRVELGEVEAAVARAFDCEAHCIAFEPREGRKSIAAYVVRSDANGMQSDLGELERSLPVHMRPSYIVPVDSLPVTINDKIDTGKLPLPSDEHLLARHKAASNGASAGDDGPASELEREITESARELLEISGPIEPADLFVDLGADSLTIVQLVIEVQEAYSVTLPVKRMKAVELSARSLAALVEARSPA